MAMDDNELARYYISIAAELGNFRKDLDEVVKVQKETSDAVNKTNEEVQKTNEKVVETNERVTKTNDDVSTSQRKKKEETEEATKAAKEHGGALEELQNHVYRLALGYAGFEGAMKLVEFFKKCTEEAMKESAAFGQLEAAAGANAKALSEFASAQMKVTTANKEDLLQAEARISSFTKYLDSQEKITKAAQDLAAAKQAEGLTVTRAADILSRTIYEGSTSIQRYGINVKDLRDGEDRLEGVMRLVNDRFGGRAEALAKTDYGKIIQQENELAEKEAQIGKNLLGLKSLWTDTKLEFSQRMATNFIGNIEEQKDKDILKEWAKNLDVLISKADQFDKTGINTTLWESQLKRVNDQLQKLGAEWKEAPWMNNMSWGKSDFNAAAPVGGDVEHVSGKAEKPDTSAADKAAAQIKEAGYILGEAQAHAVDGEYARRIAELDVQQKKERDQFAGNSKAMKLLMRAQEIERQTLYAELQKKFTESNQKQADEAAKLKLKQEADLARADEILAMQEAGSGSAPGSHAAMVTDPVAKMRVQHQKQMDEFKKFTSNEVKIKHLAELQKQEEDKKTAELEKKYNEQRLEMYASMCGQMGQVFGDLYDVTGDKYIGLFRLQQALNSSQTVMNTSTAIMKALADLGPIAGPVEAGIIGVTGAVELAKIWSEKPPKKALGGPIGGRPHSAGGTIIEAELGEWVIRADSAQGYGQRAMSAINAGIAEVVVPGGFRNAATVAGPRAASGGYVRQGRGRPPAIINLLHGSEMARVVMSSSIARDATINHIGANALQVRQAIGV